MLLRKNDLYQGDTNAPYSIHVHPSKIKNICEIRRTKPTAVRLDASVGQLLSLELVLQNLAFTIAFWPCTVHLKAAHHQRTSTTAFPIRSVGVKWVLRLALHLLLLVSAIFLFHPVPYKIGKVNSSDAPNFLPFLKKLVFKIYLKNNLFKFFKLKYPYLKIYF